MWRYPCRTLTTTDYPTIPTDNPFPSAVSCHSLRFFYFCNLLQKCIKTGMSQQDKFDYAVAALHAAMLGDAHWREASTLINDACGMAGVHLVIVDGHSRNGPEWIFDQFYYRGELADELAKEYMENFFPQDERIPRMMRLPDRRLVHDTELWTKRELKTSATYNDFLSRTRGQVGFNVRMDGPDGLDILMAIADPTEPGGLNSGHSEMIERLLPHIRQFVRVRHALVAAAALGASFSDLLDNTQVGVIYLDPRGRIIEANARARSILRQGDGLLNRNGFLRARLATDDAKLGRLLARALPTSSAGTSSGSMTVARSPDLPRFVLHVNPVVVDQPDFGVRRVAALVLVVDPGSQPAINPGLLATSLGLTDSESRVAAWLAAGRTVRDIAVSTRRQESSVRSHVKRIHAKLGISRQADLVRMVLAAAEFAGSRSSRS